MRERRRSSVPEVGRPGLANHGRSLDSIGRQGLEDLGTVIAIE